MVFFLKDIAETTNQNIPINRLSSSTTYIICLHCYYERTDHSFKQEKCVKAKTMSGIQM